MGLRYRTLSSLALLVVAACSSNATPSSSGSASESDSGTASPRLDAGAGQGQGSGDAGAGEAGALPVPTSFSTITLDWSSVPSDTPLTDQFAEYVTFSSTGHANYVTHYGKGCGLVSEPDFGPCNTTVGGCTDQPATTLTFTHPVRKLELGVGCIESAGGTIGEAVVVQSGGKTTTVPILGGATATVLDLSSYDDVTQLTLKSVTDKYGVTYGDLTFDFPKYE